MKKTFRISAALLSGLALMLSLSACGGSEDDEDTVAPEQPAATLSEPASADANFTVKGITFKMIAVQGGTFQMGSNAEESSAKPVHQVTLSDYYIGSTEVTQELWEAVMGNNPSGFVGSKLPVESVSWDDCQEFISKLNTLTGKTFRLPTEAEWEYAARGGQKSRGYAYSGSDDIDQVGWFYGNSANKLHEVGLKKPNELGIYDMTGNVSEKCSDWYGSYGSEAQTNPTGAAAGYFRVTRDGSYLDYATDCLVTRRSGIAPSVSGSDGGFRLAL